MSTFCKCPFTESKVYKPDTTKSTVSRKNSWQGFFFPDILYSALYFKNWKQDICTQIINIFLLWTFLIETWVKVLLKLFRTQRWTQSPKRLQKVRLPHAGNVESFLTQGQERRLRQKSPDWSCDSTDRERTKCLRWVWTLPLCTGFLDQLQRSAPFARRDPANTRPGAAGRLQCRSAARPGDPVQRHRRTDGSSWNQNWHQHPITSSQTQSSPAHICSCVRSVSGGDTTQWEEKTSAASLSWALPLQWRTRVRAARVSIHGESQCFVSNSDHDSAMILNWQLNKLTCNLLEVLSLFNKI